MVNIHYNYFTKKQYNLFANLLTSTINTVVSTLNIATELEVNVMLVSKHTIKKVNKQTRNKNKVTDVLSFPTLNLTPSDSKNLSELVTKENFKSDVNPETKQLFIGDIMLCYPVVKKQAKQYGNTLQREIGYMTVHGMLHLLGYDHMQESDKKQMRTMEEAVLNQLGLTRE